MIYTYRYRRSAILLIHDPNVTVAPTAMMVWGLRWEFLITAATNGTPIHLEYFKGFKSLKRETDLQGLTLDPTKTLEVCVIPKNQHGLGILQNCPNAQEAFSFQPWVGLVRVYQHLCIPGHPWLSPGHPQAWWMQKRSTKTSALGLGWFVIFCNHVTSHIYLCI